MKATLGPTASIALLIGGLAGCASSPEDVRLPVAGKVMIGDKAAASGSVVFKPDAAKGNKSKHEPRGRINEDGGYVLETTTQKGAPEGWYKVGVTVTAPADPKNPYAEPKHLIARDYGDPELSGISMNVEKSPAAGAYDIRIDPKAKPAP